MTSTACATSSTCNLATYGNDLVADPYLVTNNNDFRFVSTACGQYTPARLSDYWQVNFSAPAEISSVYFVNRVNTVAASERIATGNGMLTLMNQFGDVTSSFNMANSYPHPGTVETFTVQQPNPVSPPDPTDATQLDLTARLLSVRFLRINASAGKCLTFREVFAFDKTQTNVARGRPTTSSALAGTSTSAMGVDGIIDFDNVAASSNLVSSAACDGSAWWMVDLGGIYNLSSVIIWNYYPVTSVVSVGQGFANRMVGAQLQALNYNGDVINVTTLNGGAVQTIRLATYAPTPSHTPSNSPSPSITPTPTVTTSGTPSLTASNTPSNSATATASISFGTTPSNTPSNSPTMTATPTGTASPLSAYPVRAVLSTSGAGQCLEFAELIVFDVNGRDVSAIAAGAVSSLSSPSLLGSASGAAFGGDLQADPFGTYAAPVIAGCATTGDSYSVTFPPAPSFPGGYPIQVATAYVVNVVAGSLAGQLAASNAKLALFSPRGNLVVQQSLFSNSTVYTLPLGGNITVSVPDPTAPVQLSNTARSLYARFVRILAAPASCLYFRE